VTYNSMTDVVWTDAIAKSARGAGLNASVAEKYAASTAQALAGKAVLESSSHLTYYKKRIVYLNLIIYASFMIHRFTA